MAKANKEAERDAARKQRESDAEIARKLREEEEERKAQGMWALLIIITEMIHLKP